MNRKDHEDLTRAILEATSGPACGSARDRLCDRVDGLLEDVDAELVDLHARTCADCAGLASALRAMGRDLPALARLDPGPGFTDAVLAATGGPRRLPLAARIAGAVQTMLMRPRFALEGAFIGSILLVLLFGTPNSPFAGVPHQALALASVNPVEEIREPAAEIEAALSQDVKSAWETTSVRVAATTKTVAGKIRGSFSVALEALTTGRPDDDSTEPNASSSRLSDHEDTERDESMDRSPEDGERPDGDSE